MARPGRHGLTDDQFNRIKHLLPKEKDRAGMPASISNRRVLHGVLHVLKTGCPWRDLPRHIGPWNAIYKRYRSWCKNEVTSKILLHLAKQSDDEWHSLDGTIVPAHQDACRGSGSDKKKPSARAVGVKRRKLAHESTHSDT